MVIEEGSQCLINSELLRRHPKNFRPRFVPSRQRDRRHASDPAGQAGDPFASRARAPGFGTTITDRTLSLPVPPNGRTAVPERAERVEDVAETPAVHDETKWGPLTTEFAAMVVFIIAILIAAAVSDSLGDVRAWTLVAAVGSAYIVSRGIAKAGTRHAWRGSSRRPRS